MSGINSSIRQSIESAGYSKIAASEKSIANTLNELDPETELSQTELLKLQQKISSQTNTLGMMTAILKTLADSDKEVIRNC